MKFEALKNHSDHFVRIRPALQRYDNAARLEMTLEDSWWLTEVTSKGVKLQNQATGHTRVLGLDHIHHYLEDPDSARTGGPQGILVLNVQLLLFNRELLIEPVAPPGAALRSFVPTQKREDFLSAAKRLHAHTELANARKNFASSPEGIKKSDDAFNGILEAVGSIETTLVDQGNPVDIVSKKSGFLIVIGAFGWWASITWERYANTLDNSRLTIKKWDGHPPYPAVFLLRKPNCVAIDQYTFGLVDTTQAEWIPLDNEELHVSSKQIAMDILHDFMSNPTDPKSWFE